MHALQYHTNTKENEVGKKTRKIIVKCKTSKVKLEAYAITARGFRRPSPISLALEPLMEIHPLPRDIGPVCNTDSHCLPSLPLLGGQRPGV